MLKALIRKQLMEFTTFLLVNKKTGKRRTKGQLAGMIVLVVLLVASLAMAFVGMSLMLADGFMAVGMDWLFFAIVGMISIVLGIFGEVFTTYNGLFHAKDNDLLLSMPIKPSNILFARMLSCYILGLVYESVVMIPASIVYLTRAGVTFAGIAMPVLMIIINGLFIQTLTCVLGWVVAMISSKLKNKSIITTLLFLIFLAAYYVVYFRINSLLAEAVANAELLATAIRGKLFLFYQMALAFCGKLSAFAVYSLIVLALFALTCYVMSRSFIRIATTKTAVKKNKYKTDMIKSSSISSTLIRREGRRLVSNSTYMLNSILGIVIIVVGTVVLLVKFRFMKETLSTLLSLLPEDHWVLKAIPAMIICLVSFIASMNCVSSPSISLEGKHLWILQSSPVLSKDVLKAKELFHMMLCTVPTACVTAVLCAVTGLAVLPFIAVVCCSVLFTWLTDLMGLVTDLKHPNLVWTSEAIPVKQGAGIFVCMFGGWAIAIAVGGLGYLMRNTAVFSFYSGIVALAMLCACIVLHRWLVTRGAVEFSEL